MTRDPWLRKDSGSWLRISRSARYGNSNARSKWLRMMRRRSTTMASLSLGFGRTDAAIEQLRHALRVEAVFHGFS